MSHSQQNKGSLTDDDIRWIFTRFIDRVAYRARLDYLEYVGRRRIELPFNALEENMVDLNAEKVLYANDGLHFEYTYLEKAFEGLTVVQRQILSMTFSDRLPAFEIAARLNKNIQFVYKQKHYALKRLKEAIGEEDDHDKR